MSCPASVLPAALEKVSPPCAPIHPASLFAPLSWLQGGCFWPWLCGWCSQRCTLRANTADGSTRLQRSRSARGSRLRPVASLPQAGATAVSGSISDSLQTPKNRSGTAPALRTALSTSAPGASRGNSANQVAPFVPPKVEQHGQSSNRVRPNLIHINIVRFSEARSPSRLS